jgi:hypothetical protein
MSVSGEERISAVEVVPGQGLYTIMTKEEYVVVNGIIASPFAVKHMMANLYYNMHRSVYESAPALCDSSIIRTANEVRQCSVSHSTLSYHTPLYYPITPVYITPLLRHTPISIIPSPYYHPH